MSCEYCEEESCICLLCDECGLQEGACECDDDPYYPGWSDVDDEALDSPTHGQARHINRMR